MRLCRNRDCRVPLTSSNRSTDNPAWCAVCGDIVWAFRPNSTRPDCWCLVSEALPTLDMVVMGEACEGCYLTCFRVEPVRPRGTEAVCCGQVADGEWRDGCGARWPIRQKMACEVVF